MPGSESSIDPTKVGSQKGFFNIIWRRLKGDGQRLDICPNH